jgi:diaminohydroxyphosphoribosylaminopyrimidine deaminase / 5-amino-6-(5-phosphoribosylamino)uracil reductase
MLSDEHYMLRCIQLANLGKGHVAPNPLVGAVIVLDDIIIGEGYHQKYGEAHAEVNAVNAVEDHSLLKKATIYVSLEPCAHHGKTPPCANLLVKHGFNRVVIGCSDSYSEVSGKGIEILKDAGIQVDLGILEKECRNLNKHFFTFHEEKRPYVLLKWAETSNGLIDNGSNEGEITWISAPETQALVHKWRSDHQAILVGRKTVENDNPSLTVRAIDGNNPIRVILDSDNVLSQDSRVFNQESKTIVLNTKLNEKRGNISFLQLTEMNPSSILSTLHEQNIQSVLIEGGRQTLQSFIDANLWDEAKVIIGQQNFESGTEAPSINGSPNHSEKFFSDTINTYSKV